MSSSRILRRKGWRLPRGLPAVDWEPLHCALGNAGGVPHAAEGRGRRDQPRLPGGESLPGAPRTGGAATCGRRRPPAQVRSTGSERFPTMTAWRSSAGTCRHGWTSNVGDKDAACRSEVERLRASRQDIYHRARWGADSQRKGRGVKSKLFSGLSESDRPDNIGVDLPPRVL